MCPITPAMVSSGVPASSRRVASECRSECIPWDPWRVRDACPLTVKRDDVVKVVIVAEWFHGSLDPEKQFAMFGYGTTVLQVFDEGLSHLFSQWQRQRDAGLRLCHLDLVLVPANVLQAELSNVTNAKP